jgi:hypothetical protein
MAQTIRVLSDKADRRMRASILGPSEGLVTWRAAHTSDLFYRLNEWVVSEALSVPGVVRALAEYPMRRCNGA